MRVDCYAKSLPRQGRTANENAFLMIRESIPVATVCGGAGDAEQAARRASRIFQLFARDAIVEEMLDAEHALAGCGSPTQRHSEDLKAHSWRCRSWGSGPRNPGRRLPSLATWERGEIPISDVVQSQALAWKWRREAIRR